MATKGKKRRSRSGRIFYPVYCCCVLIALAAIALVMRTLWANMEDYEASMPKYVAQEVEKIFTEKDFAAIYEYDDTSMFSAEGKDAYVEYMQNLTAGQELVCKESFSANKDEKVYQVKFGGNKLGHFTLCKSGLKSEKGNDLWQLKEIRTSVIEPKSYSITVPETSSVYADGQPLSDSDVVESGLARSSGYLPEGFEAASWCTYSVDRCFKIPDFDVVDAKGRDQTIIPDKDGQLTVKVNFDDDDMRHQMEEYVIKVAKVFARFTSDDASTSAIMKFVKEDTNASSYIYGFDGGWFLAHRSVDFEKMRTANYVVYDENTFSCNVYFDYIIKYKKTTEVYPTGYSLFFEKQGDHWLLFDFSVTA